MATEKLKLSHHRDLTDSEYATVIYLIHSLKLSKFFYCAFSRPCS